MFTAVIRVRRPSARALGRPYPRLRGVAAFALVAAICGAASPAGAWNPPSLIQQYGLAFDCSACQKDYRGFAVDSQGNIFVSVDFFLLKFNSGGVLEWNRTYSTTRFHRMCGVDVDADGNVYSIDGYTHIIHKLGPDGAAIAAWQGDPEGYWLGAGFGLRLDQDGSVLVRTQSQTQRIAADGEREARWYSGGVYAVAMDGDRNVYTGERGTIYKTTTDGTPLATFGPTPFPEGTFVSPSGIAVDEFGFIYVVDGGPLVRIFDSEGRYRVTWTVNNGHLHDIRFVGARLAILNGGSLDIYGHPGNFPPPPPPPPSHVVPSHIMLHIGPVVAQNQVCFNGPSSADQIVTSGDADQNGKAEYYVYLLGSPRRSSDPEGLAGMQLGIDYSTGGPGRSAPLAVQNWVLCSDLQFPGDNWPGPGSGNTITWAECRMTPLVVAGAFYVSAYSAATMSIVPFPPTGLIKTANCNAAEMLPDQSLGPDEVGWVSIRHGAIGPDADGCNPAMEPCTAQTVPVKRITWGQIKNLYGAPAAKATVRN
jgi:hypothetical protein